MTVAHRRATTDAPGPITSGLAVLLATEWPEYLRLDWARVRRVMRGVLLLDGRNALHGAALTNLGFEYRSFGRPHHRKPPVADAVGPPGDGRPEGVAAAAAQMKGPTPSPVA